jgi:hypothetical protein
VNGYLDRIVYAHSGSLDFQAVASSLGRHEYGLHDKFRYYGRLEVQRDRPPSTWYWADGKTAVVIRRLPGNQGDGRDDRAHVLLGNADELDLQRALALADNCPLWTDGSWRAAGVLDKIDAGQLPDPLPLWDRPDVTTDAVNNLWPIVHAVCRRPELPIWVFDTLSEGGVVDQIRTLVGMAAILTPNEMPWTFATGEDSDVRGSLEPRIRFVRGWGTSRVASDTKRTVVRSDYQGATADEEQKYRDLVTIYLADGPEALQRELDHASVSTVPARTPTIPPRQDGQRTPAEHSFGQPLPAQQIPPPPESAATLFNRLWNAHDDELSVLVLRLTQTRVTEQERNLIRSDLVNPHSMTCQRFNKLEPAQRNQLLTQLITMTAMRPKDWRSPDASRSTERLLQAIGAPAREERRHRNRRERRSYSDLMPLALWLMGATILVLALIVATTVTG